MKSKLLLLSLLAGWPALAHAALSNSPGTSIPASTTKSGALYSGPLQITVVYPASRQNFGSLYDLEEDVADYVIEAFRQQGFTGKMAYVQRGEEPVPGQPVLAVTLTEWRRGFTGDVNCALVASLVTGDTRKSLGLFSGVSLLMGSRGDWMARNDAFDEAIRDAVNDLPARVKNTNLLGK